jgi:hypothetical protein
MSQLLEQFDARAAFDARVVKTAVATQFKLFELRQRDGVLTRKNELIDTSCFAQTSQKLPIFRTP